VIELRRDGEMERIEVEHSDSYQLELENLSEAIRGAADPLLGREDAVGQARVIDALYRSAASGTAASL
jgi:predicted dehydrogenase